MKVIQRLQHFNEIASTDLEIDLFRDADGRPHTPDREGLHTARVDPSNFYTTKGFSATIASANDRTQVLQIDMVRKRAGSMQGWSPMAGKMRIQLDDPCKAIGLQLETKHPVQIKLTNVHKKIGECFVNVNSPDPAGFIGLVDDQGFDLVEISSNHRWAVSGPIVGQLLNRPKKKA